jgi:uncharacterized protein YjbJ (UPF0337 family)
LPYFALHSNQTLCASDIRSLRTAGRLRIHHLSRSSGRSVGWAGVSNCGALPMLVSSAKGIKRESMDIIKARWTHLRTRLKLKWPRLTAGDIAQREGHRGYLVEKLRERYGIAKEKAQMQVKEFERSLVD